MDLVQVMKALADETRLRILNLLGQGELCVCELEQILDINQSNASRHLNKLTTAGMIFFEKRALYVYYQLNDELMETYPFIRQLIGAELVKIRKCEMDNKRLKMYRESGITCEDLKQGKLCFDKK